MSYKTMKIAEKIDRLEKQRAEMVARHASPAEIGSVTRELNGLRQAETELRIRDEKKREAWG